MLFLAMCLRTLFELVNADSIVNILLLLLLEEKVLLVSNRVTLLPVGLVIVCRVIDVSIVQFVFISLITLINNINNSSFSIITVGYSGRFDPIAPLFMGTHVYSRCTILSYHNSH